MDTSTHKRNLSTVHAGGEAIPGFGIFTWRDKTCLMMRGTIFITFDPSVSQTSASRMEPSGKRRICDFEPQKSLGYQRGMSAPCGTHSTTPCGEPWGAGRPSIIARRTHPTPAYRNFSTSGASEAGPRSTARAACEDSRIPTVRGPAVLGR